MRQQIKNNFLGINSLSSSLQAWDHHDRGGPGRVSQTSDVAHISHFDVFEIFQLIISPQSLANLSIITCCCSP